MKIRTATSELDITAKLHNITAINSLDRSAEFTQWCNACKPKVSGLNPSGGRLFHIDK